ncbi:DUF6056 family protein [Hymenobacter baengnokdamensis]|uniref:DUF6056 family protein n=1 Tax=Hymenobacter baengnokdamensis TaxID=2615203 RepID=UPI001248869D|nr:DUF6056 family protein [Hymenobacter baengnokdamensis]
MSIAQTPQAASWRRLLRRVWPWRRWLLGGLLALLLLPYVALCLYSQPYWDDYDYAALARRVGQWPAQRYLYMHFTGRYFTLLLTRLNPLAYGWLPGFKWLSLGWLGATLVVQALALRVLARQRLSWRAAAGWSGALVLAQLYVMPSPYGAFYWFSSAVVYQVPVILAMLFPVAALQAGRAPHFAGRAAWYAVAALALLGMVGSNELALLLAAWFLGWCCWLSYRRASYPALRRWLGLAAVALAGALVVVLAPGNAIRLQHENPGLAIPLYKVAGRALAQTLLFLTEPRQLTALLVLPVLLAQPAYRYRHLRPAGLRLSAGQGVLFVLGGLGLQMLFLSFTAWGYPAARTLNFLWFSLLASWLLVGWATLPAEGPRRPGPLLRRLRLPVLLYAALLAGGGTERAAWRELLENAPAWQRQQAARTAAIEAAKQAGAREVSVEPLRGIHPQNVLIIGETLSPDARARYNQDAARWYGLDSLRLSRPGLEPANVNLH